MNTRSLVPGLDLLRFGIPSLDQLFSPSAPPANAPIQQQIERLGIRLAGSEPGAIKKGATSLSLIGRSGTGKSVLGLHLASRYLADCAVATNSAVKVFYASTDLTHARALGAWTAFGLELPNQRVRPFERARNFWGGDGSLEIQLAECDASLNIKARETGEETGLNALGTTAPDAGMQVYFIDLARSTAGDDWGLLVRLLALLPPPGPEEPKHLLVIDAVEGLETLAGSVDPHGQKRSRRSRIAQVLRTAGDKCHVAFVLEESSQGNVPDEEFVTDVVLRLHSTETDGYMRRTLEITKARGGSPVRGKHDYIIRGGEGTRDALGSTPDAVEFQTPDDPPNRRGDGKKLAYFYVVHSLHWLTRSRMLRSASASDAARAGTADPKATAQVSADPTRAGYAKFDTPKLPRTLPVNGLPFGQVTVLTGDEATYKGRFGRAFLSGCFMAANSGEVAVYITTHNLSRHSLMQKLKWHLTASEARAAFDAAEPDLNRRVVFRQLEAHNLDSPTLFHIIRRCVERGLEVAMEPISQDRVPQWYERHPCAHLVRVVIDDWTSIKNSYPQVAHDPLFLPFLVRYLEERGVTTLIIETSPGRPDQIFGDAETQRNLRAIVSNHLMTWHVRFLGEDRVAIAAVPPLHDRLPPVVSELRGPPAHELRQGEVGTDERLWADPHFELYTGLDRGEPQPVPLEVHLFAAAENFPAYREQTNAVFNRLFTASSKDVIQGYEPEKYAALREYTRLLGGVRSERTTVMQVDEYWRPAPHAVHSEQNMYPWLGIDPYIVQPVTDREGNPHCITDPFSEFQLSDKEDEEAQRKVSRDTERRYQRHAFFDVAEAYGDGWEQFVGKLNTVPYLWDFGFLLLRKNLWTSAESKLSEYTKSARAELADLELVHRVSQSSCYPVPNNPGITWLDFFKACRIVARLHAGDVEGLRIFDMEMLSPQTFACLVLEIWASEADGPQFEHLRHRKSEMKTLAELLSGHRDAFFRTWLLLGEVLDPSSLLGPNGYLKTRPACHMAVAERHWYSTAALVWQNLSKADVVVPARLPGRYTTRGDWFLTVGSESRSTALGERTMDLLSRRKDNVIRLELGLGLPVRDFAPKFADEEVRSKIYKRMRTAMAYPAANGALHTVTYDELRALGACSLPGPDQPLKWLWRSQIALYHQHDRVWERWLARLMTSAARWNELLKSVDLDGFVAYERTIESAAKGKRSKPVVREQEAAALKSVREQFDGLIDDLLVILTKLTRTPEEAPK